MDKNTPLRTRTNIIIHEHLKKHKEKGSDTNWHWYNRQTENRTGEWIERDREKEAVLSVVGSWQNILHSLERWLG